MRLAVLGDSHTAALKLAWDRAEDAGLPALWREVAPVFFAHRRHGILDLRPEAGQLVPENDSLRAAIRHTSGGFDAVVAADFDAFLVYGLHRHAPVMEDGTAYSRALREAAVLDRVAEGPSVQMVRKVRQITDRPVHVALSPLLVPRDRTLPPPLMPYHAEIALLQDRIFAPLGAVLLAQPAETVVQDRATADHFAQGSVRLDIGDKFSGLEHGPNETEHMNADYGRVWLDHMLPNLITKAKAA